MRPFGQRIFHSGRYFGVYCAGDIAVLLQGAQGYGQHLLRDVWNFALQLLEAHRPTAGLVQRIKDQKRPFVAKPGEDIPYRAIGKYSIFYCCSVHCLVVFQITLQR